MTPQPLPDRLLAYYDLLPCPFCGGQPRVDESRITHGYSVHCPNCDAAGGWQEGNSKQQTIDAWNRRTPAATLSGREAVATVCLRGETYAHGLMTELQVQHAEGVEFPIGTKLYTTPQGDGVVVPMEPTEDMLDALRTQEAYCENCKGYSFDARNGYAAMLAAAPSAKGVAP